MTHVTHRIRTSLLALALAVSPALATAAYAADAAAPKASKADKKRAAAKATTPAAAPAGGPATAPADSSPIGELRKSNAQLKKVLGKASPNWSPEAEAKNSEVRKIVGGFLDFEELGRRSLVAHWDKLTPKQRTEFVSTLRDLVERSYIRQIHGQPDYDLKLDKETRDGNEATVTGALHTKARGKKVTVALEYKMMWKGGRWVVYDVVTDEQSLLENYRAEFNKIINKESFDALLKRMKKKLQEKPADTAEKTNIQ